MTGWDSQPDLGAALSALAGAASNAAEPPPSRAVWQRGRRRRRVRVASQGVGALGLAGALVAAPTLLGAGDRQEGPAARPSPSATPSATPSPGPEPGWMPPEPPAAVASAGGRSWKLWTERQDGKLCVAVARPDTGYPGSREVVRDGKRVRVPAYGCGAEFVQSLTDPVSLLGGDAGRDIEPGEERFSDPYAEFYGLAQGAAARVRVELLSGDSVEVAGDQLAPVKGERMRFWAARVPRMVEAARVVAYDAHGAELGAINVNPEATGPAPRADLLRPDPNSGTRIVDVRFNPSTPPAERTSLLVALEVDGVNIEYARDGRYLIAHNFEALWPDVRAALTAAQGAGRLSFTMVRGQLVTTTPTPGATPGP
jgi:hypothetical protein